MNIHERIKTELAAWMAHTNEEPDLLFLGDAQYSELQTDFERYGFTCAVSGPSRVKYCGMQVYRVNANSFIGFGISTPSPCG